MSGVQAFLQRAPSIRHQPRSKRYYFDVAIGSVCLAGADTGGAYCLLELGLAPGMSVPRHTHTREDEAYHVLSGELEVVVGDDISFSGQAILSYQRRKTDHDDEQAYFFCCHGCRRRRFAGLHPRHGRNSRSDEGAQRRPRARLVRRRVMLVRGDRTTAGGGTQRDGRAKPPDDVA